MTALSKFLVLLALFLLASHANAFTSHSLVAGNQVWVNHLIRLQQPMSDPTNKQVANRFANQPMIKSMIKQQIKQRNDWNRMHCFLTTSHQKEYCFECQ
jgi:hypothetical protein